jgi:ParB-like chromosome segregation protein Spo0J
MEYLERAAQLREVRGELRDRAARELLRQCAEDYERMADDAARQSLPSIAGIDRAAARLIGAFGADAKIEAAKHAALTHHRGDMHGHRRWLAIMRAIDKIERIQPTGRRH